MRTGEGVDLCLLAAGRIPVLDDTEADIQPLSKQGFRERCHIVFHAVDLGRHGAGGIDREGDVDFVGLRRLREFRPKPVPVRIDGFRVQLVFIADDFPVLCKFLEKRIPGRAGNSLSLSDLLVG